VAIGIFWAFTPLLGLKTLLPIFFAWAFRCSKISAALAISASGILTPVWLFVLRWEYDLGFWILSYPHHFPHRLSGQNAHLKYWFHWTTLEILWPTFLGSLLFSGPLALISYLMAKKSLNRYGAYASGQLTSSV
jgi:uncharacterized protein (DUF2062 family)